MNMQKIKPFLWYNGDAEEAMNLYVSTFKNSKVDNLSYYPEGSSMPAGTLMMASFVLEGQEFMVLNGGPEFKFTEALSLFVTCENQAEVDWYWSQLSSGGEEGQCGWLKDKFGVSWQIVPTALGELMGVSDPAKAQRVMQAMLQMRKIDVAGLQRAHDQE
jgi:predicted 3-demethylubiquinone-9 3-methyltransferase (glyoxalase superfamily)